MSSVLTHHHPCVSMCPATGATPDQWYIEFYKKRRTRHHSLFTCPSQQFVKNSAHSGTDCTWYQHSNCIINCCVFSGSKFDMEQTFFPFMKLVAHAYEDSYKYQQQIIK